MRQKPLIAGLVLAVAALVAGCSPGESPDADESVEAATPEPTAPESTPPGSADAPTAASPAPETAPDSEREPAEETDPLRDPDSAEATRRAPDSYRARFRTSGGDFVVEVHRDWAPRGADRFYNLVRLGFFDDTYLFRVVEGFVAQFGISGDPEVSAAWSWAEIEDDPVIRENARGTITFATAGPNTRTTQVFVNTGDNTDLDGMGFAPFGRVVEGLEVLDSAYSGYGDIAPFGGGPDPGRIEDRGNAYLQREFPDLDRILEARIE